MKVALLTWFHYHNYGTALQVTALYEVIKDLGYEVDIVNYRPSGKVITLPNQNLVSYYTEKLHNKIVNRNIINYTPAEREEKFDVFLQNNLSFTDECTTYSDLRNLNREYDAFVCGSDQIWSPLCFDRHYFLDFVTDDNKKIAYAPSIGTSEVSDPDIRVLMAKLTCKFAWLSTREETGSVLLESLINRNVQTVLDPVFLRDISEWDKLLPEEGFIKDSDYLLVYFLRDNKHYWDQIYKFADELKLEVKIIPVFTKDIQREGCVKTPIGPAEFLRLVKNASFVCTDSFHGIAFSIIYQKDFIAFERFRKNEKNNQNSRIYNILNKLGLQNRLYNKNYSLNITQGIDYSSVNEKLQSLIEESRAYLVEALAQTAHRKTDIHVESSFLELNGFCCGCGACAEKCPTNAITMSTEGGFWEAKLNADLCVKCGACINICPLTNKSTAKPVNKGQLYSYKDYDEQVLKKSSSGGIAYRIAETYLKKGYSVIGCCFDKKTQSAKHIIVTPDQEELLTTLQGSKYMQSDFADIMDEIDCGRSPLVIFGTPCQIAAAKKIAPKDRSILYVDLNCRGVPSTLIFRKYQEYLHDKFHINMNDFAINFRSKKAGRQDRYIYIKDSSNVYCKNWSKDPYCRIYESGFCYSKPCYECRWRDRSDADIRIGDYCIKMSEEPQTSVSAAVSFDENGENALREIRLFGEIENGNNERYFLDHGTCNAPCPVFYNRLLQQLFSKSETIKSVLKKFVIPFEKQNKISDFISRMKSYK